MKVLYIADPLIVGGATRALVELVTEFYSRGIECVVCTSGCNELSEEFSNYNIPNFASGHRAVMDVRPITLWKRPIKFLLKAMDYYLNILPAIHKIESNIDMSTVDLIHTNSVRSDIGMFLSDKYGIPHVAHIREFGAEDFDCWTYRIGYTRFINRHTTVMIAISEAVKNCWVKKGIDKNKTVVIYDGVSDSTIISTDQERMLRDNILKLVAVGGICEPKGQLHIIEAMGLLPKEIQSNITLDIIGWGDSTYIDLIKHRANKLEIANQIKIFGQKFNIGELLQNYHVGLTCSKSEGFGRVTAEYMHAGIGIIASDTGANPELIEDRVTGLLYHYNDVKELANKIEEVYKNRGLLIRCATEGQKRAKEKYRKTLNADNIYKLYQEVLEQTHNTFKDKEYGEYEH